MPTVTDTPPSVTGRGARDCAVCTAAAKLTPCENTALEDALLKAVKITGLRRRDLHSRGSNQKDFWNLSQCRSLLLR
jgi:hypothetical protein